MTSTLRAGTKWRAYLQRARTLVFCDMLAERGVWPFVRYDFRPNIAAEMMRALYGDLEWIMYEGQTGLGIPYSVDRSVGQLWHGSPITLDTLAPPPPLTMAGILATLERQVALDEAIRRSPPPLFVSPAQLRDYNLLGVVSAVDPKTKTITVSSDGVDLGVPPRAWSRRPAFIPVRRLDGRR